MNTIWTPAAIEELWNWYSRHAYARTLYFSRHYGATVAHIIRSAGCLRGRLLDYGCGSGELIGQLIGDVAEAYGADVSSESVEMVNHAFSGQSRWRGAVVIQPQGVDLPDASFDLITCLETLEHLDDEPLAFVLRQIFRLLKPGGVVFFTTPFAENLDKETVYCPFCRREFHRWQHVRSFTEAGLADLLRGHGLSLVFADHIDLDQFRDPPRPGPWHYAHLAGIYHWLRYKMLTLLDRWRPRPFPHGRSFRFLAGRGNRRHLCVLAQKPGP